MTATIRLERIEHQIALVTLDRPEAGNAWTLGMAAELSDAMAECDRDDSLRAVVVTGAGKVFSVGADLKSGSIDRPGDDPEAQGPTDPILPSQVRKPVIAAINGHCVGGGISFSLHCDFRLVAREAKIAFAFARRGVIGEMNAHWLLPQLVGAAKALDLLLTGRTITGEEAVEMGLCTRVLPAADVVGAAIELAATIGRDIAQLSAAFSKQLVWAASTRSYEEAFEAEMALFHYCAAQPDAVEGVMSFLEKRAPRWTGRPFAERDRIPQ